MLEFSIFDSFLDSILVVDSKNNVHYGNVAASTLFEVSSKRLSLGKSLSQYVEFASIDTGENEMTPEKIQGIQGASQFKEVSFKTKSDKTGTLQFNMQLVGDDRWLVYLRDVSLEKTLHIKYRGELDSKENVIKELEAAKVQLLEYSKNLESKVQERTRELSDANRLQKAILDSLGQGILVFNAEGICLPVFSQVCKQIFGKDPTGMKIEEVLAMNANETDSFEKWRQATFSEMLAFEDMSALAPKRWAAAKDKEIGLDYYAMRGAENEIRNLVLVATDRTAEAAAQAEAMRERVLVKKLAQVARNRNAFRQFLKDSRALLAELQTSKGGKSDRVSILRRLHNLKGGAASFSFDVIARSVHGLESIVHHASEIGHELRREISDKANEIQAELLNQVNALSEMLGKLDKESSTFIEIPDEVCLRWAIRLLESNEPKAHAVGVEIASACVEAPIENSIKHHEVSLREMAAKQGKVLNKIELIGGETLVPEKPLQPLMNSLIHAFRNSIDHGLETKEERLKLRKKLEGLLQVKVIKIVQPDGTIDLIMEIKDDGRGINAEKVREKCKSLGLNDWLQKPHPELFQVLLLPEFSTAETVTEVSGRGVGLSAIAEEVQKLGGSIVISSVVNLGMSILIKVRLPSLRTTVYDEAMAIKLDASANKLRTQQSA